METSFTQPPSPSVELTDVAVQVSLPRRSATPASVPHLPRMGRLVRAAGASVCHQRSTSDDLVVNSRLTESAGLGGSMPCVQPPSPDHHVLVRVDDPDRHGSATGSFCSSPGGTGRTTTLSVLKSRGSQRQLQCDDEGYLTKESTTSASSVDISRHSPVFF